MICPAAKNNVSASPGLLSTIQKFFFADEPTGNLDSATGDKVIDLLFGLNKKGVTLIIVTHDDDLAKLCDRQIRISDGKIIEDTGVKPKVTKAASAAKKNLAKSKIQQKGRLKSRC